MWEIEYHKKGKRKYGWWVKNTTTDVLIYVARMSHKNIHQGGESSVSEAMRLGTASFAIKDETMQLCKIKKVKFVGVMLKDTGTLYLTSIDEFYNPANRVFKNNLSSGGVQRRYLTLDKFRVLHQVSL